MESQGHATAMIDGREVTVRRTRLLPGEDGVAARPGTVLRREDGGAVVQCGDGPLLVVDYSQLRADHRQRLVER